MERNDRFTLKHAFQLCGIHTWPGSVMPVLFATALSYATAGVLRPFVSVVLLVICVLMQSAVNVFDDYFDFVKGVDTADDNVEESDSVLVYNGIDPKKALVLAWGLLVAAFLLGIWIIHIAGFVPLAIALIGAVVVVVYSGGRTPISYLPIGEAVSGFVMGGLIPLACYSVLVGRMDFLVLVWSIPFIVSIGLIMMTNNTCDIEKDTVAGRKTLPVLLGRPRARKLYHALLFIWVMSICILVAVGFTEGLLIVVFMLVSAWPFLSKMAENPLNPQSRIQAMVQICTLNVILGAFYSFAVFV